MATQRTNQEYIVKEQHLNVLVSNSKSTSGDLVTAGYILLKAPNTTHRHYYKQYLRSKLPEATPYFDIIRFKKTPMDQLIPHLVVQCGEKHVTPVCKSLLSILTGKESALFLPRYAFRTMPQEQIKRHFEVHHNWSRSLTPIQLSKISHLDQQRVEYFDNGTIIKRSTLEWALSLTLANGQPAHCDAVNGNSECHAFLACPHSYLEQANIEWKQYRSRLNPPSHREARYAESVSGLPDLSNISIEIETNVSILDKLSAADIWTQDPPSVRGKASPQSGRNAKKGKQRKPNKRSPPNHKPNATSASTTDILSDEETDRTSGDTTNAESDTRSTASTAVSTTAPPSANNSRFKDLERMIKQAQKRSDAEGKASADQLSGLQTKFSDLDCKMSTLQANQERLATDVSAIQENNAKQFSEISKNLLSSMEATNEMLQSLVDIRSQFTTMSTFMLELAKKMDAVLSRCDGVPPEVNFNSVNGNNQTGSEFSSGMGDPSNSAMSDVSRAASIPSSAGKRSLAASLPPLLHNDDGNTTMRPSPIKKKVRARGATDTTSFDQQDGSDVDDDPISQIPSNLDNRFIEVDEFHEDEGDISEPETPPNTSNAPTTQATPGTQPTTPNSQPLSAPPRLITTTKQVTRLGRPKHDVTQPTQ